MTYREEVGRYQREAWWTARRVFTHVMLPLFALGILGTVLGFITLPFRSAAGIAERTLNADNVLYNYEWFKSTYQEVQAAAIQRDNAEAAYQRFVKDAGPRPWDYPTSTEAGRLQAVVLGLANQRQNLVAQYNARAQMANRDIFRTRDLPEVIQ